MVVVDPVAPTAEKEKGAAEEPGGRGAPNPVPKPEKAGAGAAVVLGAEKEKVLLVVVAGAAVLLLPVPKAEKEGVAPKPSEKPPVVGAAGAGAGAGPPAVGRPLVVVAGAALGAAVGAVVVVDAMPPAALAGAAVSPSCRFSSALVLSLLADVPLGLAAELGALLGADAMPVLCSSSHCGRPVQMAGTSRMTLVWLELILSRSSMEKRVPPVPIAMSMGHSTPPCALLASVLASSTPIPCTISSMSSISSSSPSRTLRSPSESTGGRPVTTSTRPCTQPRVSSPQGGSNTPSPCFGSTAPHSPIMLSFCRYSHQPPSSLSRFCRSMVIILDWSEAATTSMFKGGGRYAT